MRLKKITAIIRSDQLEDAGNRLKTSGIPGVTVDHVHGYGEDANFFARDWMFRYARLEIVAEAPRVPAIVDAIIDVVHTGARGDGSVYTVPVETAERIRDRHQDKSESSCPRCRASRQQRARRRRRKAAAPTR